MDQNGKSDVIEISDDSSDLHYAAPGASNRQSLKRPHDVESVGDSSDSDSIVWCEESEESESDVECDFSEDNFVVLTIKPSFANPVDSLQPSSSINDEDCVKKLKICAQLNSEFDDDNFFNALKGNFTNDNATKDKNYEIITEPWKVLLLNNLITDCSLLENAREEMYEICWHMRQMDLYEFFQSPDLKNMESKYIHAIYEFLKTDLKDWVQKLVGMEFTDVSATCSFYGDTDFLLVHDDQRGTRAVAFVLYLTGNEGWNVDWGGALQLLSHDLDNQPLETTRNISPKNNQLVLFPVSNHSYHQVEEVRCKNYCRMSINGWFHVKEPMVFEEPIYTPPSVGILGTELSLPIDVEVSVSEWINNSFLDEKFVKSIQSYLEDDSEISLENFFCIDKFEELTKAIRNEDIVWKQMGPLNRRNYEFLTDEDTLPTAVQDFISFLRSKIFYKQLKKFSDLDLINMKWELQRWTSGCYSLLDVGIKKNHNKDQLDLLVYIGDGNIVGAATHYVTLEDEVQESLVTISPSPNFLNLVYGDTARYTSHMSHYNKSKTFYTFSASYFE